MTRMERKARRKLILRILFLGLLALVLLGVLA